MDWSCSPAGCLEGPGSMCPVLKKAGGQGRGFERVPARINGKFLTCSVRERKTYGKGKVGFFCC